MRNREYQSFFTDHSSKGPQKNKRKFYSFLIPENIKTIYRLIKIYYDENAHSVYEQWQEFKRLLGYIFFSASCARDKNYDISIGIDSFGIIASHISSFFSPFKATYFWSLEITESKQYKLLMILVKAFESMGHKSSDFLISQDKKRAQALCRINNVNFTGSRFFSVPHSKEKTVSNYKFDFFRKKFGLKKSDVIILHAGWIHDIMDSHNLAKSANSWPTNLKLVFHERMQRSRCEPYIKKVIQLGGTATFFSLNPVTYDRLEEIITSADIGIVNYKTETGEASWENLTKATGKLADYLSCGLPVICSNFEGAEELFTKYKCGEVFKSYDEIPSKVKSILLNYDQYKKNAFNCFEKEYKFSKYFLPVLQSMESLNN